MGFFSVSFLLLFSVPTHAPSLRLGMTPCRGSLRPGGPKGSRTASAAALLWQSTSTLRLFPGRDPTPNFVTVKSSPPVLPLRRPIIFICDRRKPYVTV